MEENKELIHFEGQPIRKIRHDEQWYFSVMDFIGVLTESKNPSNYWKVLKNRENQLVTICNQLKLPSSDGKYYKTDCAKTEGGRCRIFLKYPTPNRTYYSFI